MADDLKTAPGYFVISLFVSISCYLFIHAVVPSHCHWIEGSSINIPMARPNGNSRSPVWRRHKRWSEREREKKTVDTRFFSNWKCPKCLSFPTIISPPRKAAIVWLTFKFSHIHMLNGNHWRGLLNFIRENVLVLFFGKYLQLSGHSLVQISSIISIPKWAKEQVWV